MCHTLPLLQFGPHLRYLRPNLSHWDAAVEWSMLTLRFSLQIPPRRGPAAVAAPSRWPAAAITHVLPK